MFDQLLRRKTAGPRAVRDSVTIRQAGPEDVSALARLAALDSSVTPAAPVLLAEVAGEPWAAVSLADLAAVADPFRPTAELVLVLTERARSLRRAPRRGLPVRPRVAAAGA